MINNLFVRCACGQEGINITLDKEAGNVFFSMWYYSKPELTWKNKLRWIYSIIIGKPYPDEVVITSGWLPLIIDKLGSMMIEAEQIEYKRGKDGNKR